MYLIMTDLMAPTLDDLFRNKYDDKHVDVIRRRGAYSAEMTMEINDCFVLVVHSLDRNKIWTAASRDAALIDGLHELYQLKLKQLKQ